MNKLATHSSPMPAALGAAHYRMVAELSDAAGPSGTAGTVVLRAQGLSKRFVEGSLNVPMLQGIDMQVARGDTLAIVGASGSGKSTLLHLLGGLDEPSSGEITLAGHPITHLSDDEVTVVRRRRVGFIFQFYNLVPTLTAAENVALPLLIDGQRIEQHQEKINRLLAMVGLAERRDHKPDQMSGGQQQRVAIARAFVNDPEIVLADEPTGNLDSQSGTAILELLRQSAEALQQTIVMVTHDPRAASYADRVVFLKDGRIVQTLAIQAKSGESEDIRNIMRVMRELEL